MASGQTNITGGKKLIGTAQPSDVRMGMTYPDGKELRNGTLDLTSLTPENIRSGVTIGGVSGNLFGMLKIIDFDFPVINRAINIGEEYKVCTLPRGFIQGSFTEFFEFNDRAPFFEYDQVWAFGSNTKKNIELTLKNKYIAIKSTVGVSYGSSGAAETIRIKLMDIHAFSMSSGTAIRGNGRTEGFIGDPRYTISNPINFKDRSKYYFYDELGIVTVSGVAASELSNAEANEIIYKSLCEPLDFIIRAYGGTDASAINIYNSGKKIKMLCIDTGGH